MRSRLEIWVSKDAFAADRRFLPILHLPSGSHAVLKGPAVFEALPDHETIPEHAVLKMDEAACQKLMDQLWDTGVRPSAGSGSAGQLAATQAHLQDMRALVFKGKAP